MTGRAMILVSTVAAAAVLTVPLVDPPSKRFIWNASDSVPIGLYRLRPIGRLAVTNLVVVLPPPPLAAFLSERGYLPRGVPMLKRVLALPGQTVCRTAVMVAVDQIELGEARRLDSRGRSLPVWQGCHVVASDEIFLMNWQSATSFDGRYFGVLPTTAVVARAEPVWTDEQE